MSHRYVRRLVLALAPLCAATLAACGSASAPRACTASHSRVSAARQVPGMTGEHAFELTVTNTGSRTCTLAGYPAVTVTGRRGPLPFVYAAGGGPYVTAAAPRTVRIRPGDDAVFVVAKYRCDGRQGAAGTSLRISLPGVRRTYIRQLPEPYGAGLAYCTRYPGGARIDPGDYVVISPISRSLLDTIPASQRLGGRPASRAPTQLKR